MGRKVPQQQPPRRPLALMVLWLAALGGALLLLELLQVQRSDDDNVRFSLFRGAPDADELGLRANELAAEIALEDAADDDTAMTAWLHGGHNARDSDIRRDVPPAHLLHLSLLQAACLANSESVIPWRFGNPGANQENARVNNALLFSKNDPRLLDELLKCPDVDVYIPGALRGHGYCEDAAAYGKYLKSRLLPRWVFETPLVDVERNRTVMYHELCPHTPVILFNHYWDGLVDAPHWPKHKPVYLMPNIEMFELNEQFYWRADVVLCKTRDCEQRLRKWYRQEGSPRNTKVIYTRHTTSDVAGFARHALGAAAVKPKDFANVTFLHTAGSSGWKGTRQVLDCWLSRPDLPRLDVFVSEGIYRNRIAPDFDERVRASDHIRLSMARLEPLAFGKRIAEAPFFLCPSVMEGYGHYINQARASGGVIVTTDVAPMNELVSAPDSGVLVRAARYQNPRMFLAGAYTRASHGLRDVDGMSAHFTGADVCAAVDHILLETDATSRAALAEHARQRYHADTWFFARKMRVLRRFARKQRRQQELAAQD